MRQVVSVDLYCLGGYVRITLFHGGDNNKFSWHDENIIAEGDLTHRRML